jgi:hypothetical protein
MGIQSSDIELAGICHEPSKACSDRQHAGLLQPVHVPSSRRNIHARGQEIYVCARFPGAPVLAYVLASYRPRVLTFDSRTVPQAIPTDFSNGLRCRWTGSHRWLAGARLLEGRLLS